jgi:hypothetical protein
LVKANGLNLEVDINSTGDSVGDNKWGRCEVVGTGVWRDTTLEVSVSGKYSSCDKITLINSFRYLSRKSTTVSNASHASVSGSSKTKLVKVSVDSGGL